MSAFISGSQLKGPHRGTDVRQVQEAADPRRVVLRGQVGRLPRDRLDRGPAACPQPPWLEDDKQTSPCCPQGHGPQPCGFSPATGHFRGPPEGAMIAIMDPGKADAVMVRERHAPVVAVLLAAAKKRARRAHPRTPRAKSAASRLLLQIRHFQGHRNGCHDPDDGTPDHPIRAPAHMPRVAGP